MASRMSLLYELRSPEFFDKALFREFLDLLRARERHPRRRRRHADLR